MLTDGFLLLPMALTSPVLVWAPLEHWCPSNLYIPQGAFIIIYSQAASEQVRLTENTYMFLKRKRLWKEKKSRNENSTDYSACLACMRLDFNSQDHFCSSSMAHSYPKQRAGSSPQALPSMPTKGP